MQGHLPIPPQPHVPIGLAPVIGLRRHARAATARGAGRPSTANGGRRRRRGRGVATGHRKVIKVTAVVLSISLLLGRRRHRAGRGAVRPLITAWSSGAWLRSQARARFLRQGVRCFERMLAARRVGHRPTPRRRGPPRSRAPRRARRGHGRRRRGTARSQPASGARPSGVSPVERQVVAAWPAATASVASETLSQS